MVFPGLGADVLSDIIHYLPAMGDGGDSWEEVLIIVMSMYYECCDMGCSEQCSLACGAAAKRYGSIYGPSK